jgi:Dolichyl-phosphate-mannose-protein mannosyltransferase
MPTPPDLKSSPSSFSSGLNAIILAAAVSAGGWLRFHALGASDLTADEGASWLAASAPTVQEVYHQGLQLNPGKLAAHDLTLHFWMLAFGDSVTSIRALSALLGTIAIALVFLTTRELFASEEDLAAPLFSTDSSAIAALSALVFALNVVAIRYSREARMYELMLDATLVQLWYFLRAVRRGRLVNYAGTALFTILAIATSFVSGLVFAAEGLCLLYALRPGATRWPYAWNTAVTLMTAGAIVAGLTPWRQMLEKASSSWSWIGPGFLTEYVLGFFGAAVRSPILPVTMLLAIWGVLRGCQRYAEGTSFALAWMFVPLLPLVLWLGPIMLLVVTIYSWTPLFADRFALTCIVPLCIFVALGIWELPSSTARMAALALVVVLAGFRIHSYDPNSGDPEWGVQWRAATEAALPELKAGKPVSVVPGYGIYALRYYSRNDSVDPALMSEGNRRAQVLVLADTADYLLPNTLPALHRWYFEQLARVRGVTVMVTPLAVSQPAEAAPRAQ